MSTPNKTICPLSMLCRPVMDFCRKSDCAIYDTDKDQCCLVTWLKSTDRMYNISANLMRKISDREDEE